MQENEFEDAVGKNMEGFGVNPSAMVWTKVERSIRKEKKRRFAFWYWFLLLLLGGGIATAILFNPATNDKTTIANSQIEKNTNNPILTHVKKDSSNIGEIIIDTGKNSEEILIQKEIVVDEINTVPAKSSKISNINSSVSELKNTLYKKTGTVKATTTNKIKNQTEKKQLAANTIGASEQQFESASERETIPAEKSVSRNIVNQIDTAVVKVNKIPDWENADSVTNDLALADSFSKPIKKETANQKLNKWNWGVQFSAAKSGFSKGLFSLNKAVYAAPAYSNPGSGASGAPNPSAIKPSFSWSAGLFIKKPVSKKLDISIGIDYHYLSTHQRIGSLVDSIRMINNASSNGVQINNFYRQAGSGNTNSYTNKFHFIGLQANIAWEIIAAKKFKLYWENGIAYNRLVSSNMLYYSNSLPGYYNDNSLLHKNQFSFSMGLLLPVGEKLMLKTFLNYNLTPVFKNYSASNPHFSTFGLQLKYIFKK